MQALRLAWRGLWWRRWVSLAILAVATVTTTAAAMGPLYARAAGESTLRDRLQQSPPDSTGLHFESQAEGGTPFASVAGVPRPGSLLGYPQATRELNSAYQVRAAGSPDIVLARVRWRDGYCRHLVLVRGRCPQGAHEAVVSDRTLADGYGFGYRRTIDLVANTPDPSGFGPPVPTRVARLDVVGTYRLRSAQDPYWFGRNYLDAHHFSGSGDGNDTVDTVFADLPVMEVIMLDAPSYAFVDYPLDAGAIRLDDLGRFAAGVAAVRGKFPVAATGGVQLDSSVERVLAASATERRLVGVSSLLVTLQLALLAWLVLYLVVADSSETRGNEIALAKLRGLPARDTVVFGLAEPVLLLCAAVPLGLLGARLAVGVLGSRVLLGGTPVMMTAAPVVAALGALVGGVLAAALAARRVLTRPILEQWRRAEEGSRLRGWTVVVDLAVGGLAVLSVLRLRSDAAVSSGDGGQAALLAPALLVLAVALLGVRLVPVLGRVFVRSSRSSRRLGAFLALRQVVRRPAGLRLAVLLAVAVGVATFAVDAEAVAGGNRSTRAAYDVGADRVVAVQVPPRQRLPDLVARIDPDGRWAMATARWLPNGGTLIGTVLAADMTRFPAVASWRERVSGMPAEQVARLLRPPVPPRILVTGDALRVSLTQLDRGTGQPPTVTVQLLDGRGQRIDVPAGRLGPGARDYVTGPFACRQPCRLRGVELNRDINDFGTLIGVVMVRGIAQRSGTWRPLDVGLTRPEHWYAGNDNFGGSDIITPTRDGLAYRFTSTSGSPSIAYVDSPRPLPVLGTAGGISSTPGPPTTGDATGTVVSVRPVATAGALPEVLDGGSLVDLGFASAQLPGFASEANFDVWLSARAPADAVSRLEAAGLVVLGTRSSSVRDGQLSRQGPALALRMLVVAAVAGAVLAAGAVAVAVAVSGRRRAFELAAMLAVGVPRRALLRSCVGEQLFLLGTGLCLGVPVGLVAAELALPSIPQYADASPVALAFPLHLLAVAVFVGTLVAVLAGTALVAGHLLVRSAVPARLREAAP